MSRALESPGSPPEKDSAPSVSSEQPSADFLVLDGAQTPPSPSAAEDTLRKLYLEITTECNMDCPMCVRHQWESNTARMSEETFARILDQSRQIPSLRTIHFGGFGEPLTHPDFLRWIEEIARSGLQVEFITNGVLLDETIAERCLRLPVPRMFVSLDSARPQQNSITHADVFDVVRRNLRRLYAMKLASRSACPEVYALFVVCRSNLEELWELKRLAPYLGLQGILVSHLMPYTPELRQETLYQHWGTRPAGIPPSPWNPLVDLPRMDPTPEVLELISRLRRHGTPLRIGSTERYDGVMRCPFVSEGRAAIGPTGDVSPCLALLHSYTYWFEDRPRRIDRHVLGNIHERTLAEIWESPAYRAFRQRVAQFAFPPCIDCSGCDLRADNQQDCTGSPAPTCGACLWAAGLVQCP